MDRTPGEPDGRDVPTVAVRTLGVPRESGPDEARVAVVPGTVQALDRCGLSVLIESGAGAGAGFPDEAYVERGATVVPSREEAFGADVLAQVRVAGTGRSRANDADLLLLRPGQVLVGFADPLGSPGAMGAVAGRGVVVLAMELMPRISRAQGMDALSSQATVSGYKAVLLAAAELPKMFPLLTTAAGTIRPARVLVVGAGVAGLQAIATARRLGAVVEGYDVRPAVKEQVESLGARFLELDLETERAEGAGGYAQAMDEAFYERQREMMSRAVSASDAVITTAAVPGKPAPRLITAEMVRGMAPGSVIVDLAAEQGGNCEVTKAGQTVDEAGVRVIGPVNLAATVPNHASQMYARNISNYLAHVVREGRLSLDPDDEIAAGTVVVRSGEVVHPMVLEALTSPVPEGRAG